MNIEKLLILLNHSYSPRDMDRFITLVNNHKIHWIEYAGTIWVPSREMSVAKGKHPTTYAAAWLNKPKEKSLRGKNLVFSNKTNEEELIEIRNILSIKYPELKVPAGYRQLLLLEWIRAVDFFYYEEDSNTSANNEVALVSGEVVVDSRFLAAKLGIKHSYLKKLIKQQEERFISLGPLIRKEDSSKHFYYLLIETQCYFLTSILSNKNDVVDFKLWMINHISSLKINYKDNSIHREKYFQDKILQLSSYCSIKVRSEITVENPFGKSISTRRIDLFIEDSIAVELKKDAITTEIISEVAGDKGYFDLIYQNFPTFKTLVICSPNGINEDAKRLISLMKPKVVFMSIKQIGSFIAEFILRETPKKGHWWLYNFVFPQFKDILLNSYILDSKKEKLLQKGL